MTVRELYSRMSAREFNDWMSFYQMEPFGEEKADLRAALQTTIFANTFRAQGAPPFRPTDFMLNFDQLPDPDERAKKVSRSLASALDAMGAKEKEK